MTALLRQRWGITQRELAAISGCSKHAIARHESSGRTMPQHAEPWRQKLIETQLPAPHQHDAMRASIAEGAPAFWDWIYRLNLWRNGQIEAPDLENPAIEELCGPPCRSVILAERHGLACGDLWGTPLSLFAVLDAEFGFVLDAAAVADDTLCEAYISPEENALATSWAARCPRAGAVFCNPPYSVRGGGHLAWIRKGLAEARAGLIVVFLVAAGSGSQAMQLARREGAEIRHSKRRLACRHPDTRQQSDANNHDQKLIICTPAGGPAKISDFDPPPEACRALTRQPAGWDGRKRGAALCAS